MASNCIWIFALMWIVHGNDGARILGIFPAPAFSHQFTYQTLMKALAARGHQITVISPSPLKKPIPNYTDIDVSFSHTNLKPYTEFATWNRISLYDEVVKGLLAYQKIIDDQLSSPQIQEFIKTSNNNSYDLILFESLIFPSYHGLIHHLGSPPVIGIMPYEFIMIASYLIGIPATPSYYPDLYSAFSDRMTFHERLYNTIVSIFLRFIVSTGYYEMQESLMRKHFGSKPPSVYEAEKNFSLLMISRSVIFNYPVPLPPAAITFHSLHVKTTPDPLPKDLQKFLDEATDGVIYFSLGTNILSTQMPEEKQNIFIETFAKLPQRVLWKWESENLPGKPSNIKTGEWLPQQDILAHRNIRLFITHCGLHSIEEAVYHGVPMLGIPFFGDQKYNARKIQETKTGLILSFEDITEDSLLYAINEILYNTSFRENVRKVSAISRDEPENLLEKVVWWTEYVLRHKGAKHLRLAALDLEWYQYLLLDVTAFILISILFIIFMSYYVVKFLYSSLTAMLKTKFKND